MSPHDPVHGSTGAAETEPLKRLHGATCFPFFLGEPPSVAPVDAGALEAIPVERPTEGAMAEVRRLGPDDWPAWRALRLEALERHPEAFGAALEDERALSAGAWANRLRATVVFGAEQRGDLIGCAGLFLETAPKKRHKGVLWGVYVRAEARGAGFGRALVGRVIEAARQRVRQLHTAVVDDNPIARRLYLDVGFVPYGREPRAIQVADRFLDEELMVLSLDEPPA